MNSVPQFHVMSTAECEELLASQNVGRLAYSFRDRVDIAPVHYVYRDGWIYGRTGLGTKVEVLAHHPWVAFEVDRIDSLYRWRSVVVRGRVEIPDPDGIAQEREHYEIGVAAMRSLVPTAFSENDPTPGRDMVFRLPTHEMTGRAAAHRGT